MRILRVETGDSRGQPGERTILELRQERPEESVTLAFAGIQASVPAIEWDRLLQQVATKHLSLWQHGPVGGPIGQVEVRTLVRAIRTTPGFQLFLAAFDIADRIRFFDARDEVIRRRCQDLLSDGFLKGLTGGSIFFLRERLRPDVEDDLLNMNKLCRLTVTVPGQPQFRNVYVPYATPTSLSFEMRPEAYRAWGAISNAYRQAKGREL